jgi:hypothetical protein
MSIKSLIMFSSHLRLGFPNGLFVSGSQARGKETYDDDDDDDDDYDSRDSSVDGNFSLHHRVQNGCGAHPASYPMGTRGSFLGGKAAGA